MYDITYLSEIRYFIREFYNIMLVRTLLCNVIAFNFMLIILMPLLCEADLMIENLNWWKQDYVGEYLLQKEMCFKFLCFQV